MSSMARRAFLRFAAAAPVALPVAAKEAAASMGLQGALGAGAQIGMGLAGQTVGYADNCKDASPINHVDWLKQRMTDLLSDENLERIRMQEAAQLSRLDPDLASMRSVSPSFARHRQIDRNVNRAVESQKRWLNADLARSLKGKLGL